MGVRMGKTRKKRRCERRRGSKRKTRLVLWRLKMRTGYGGRKDEGYRR